MNKLLKSNSHGEPDNFDFILIIILLLAFGLIWSVGEKGWIQTILDLF